MNIKITFVLNFRLQGEVGGGLRTTMAVCIFHKRYMLTCFSLLSMQLKCFTCHLFQVVFLDKVGALL